MELDWRTVESRLVGMAPYGLLLILVVVLWFAPVLLHIRALYTPYNESLTIPASGENYVEREFQVYRQWETDLRLRGKVIVVQEGLWVPVAKTIRVLVFDWANYESWRRGEGYTALLESGLVATLGFDVPLPPVGRGEVRYVLVYLNPSDEPISVVHDASIDFERAFLGYSYVWWVSKAGVVGLLGLTVYWKVRSRRMGAGRKIMPGT